jgi:DNA-binding MarR family transcriptional regulator
LPRQATTGLASEQFDELVDRVGQRIVWPRELTLHQAVKAVVVYFRTNITQELIAELLFVDQSTISRAISDLEEIIAEALDEFVPELPEEIEGRVAIVRITVSVLVLGRCARAVLGQAQDHRPHPPLRLRSLRIPDAHLGSPARQHSRR